MAGYFGTDEQQHLQALVDASAAETAGMPGACQAGRIMGCDDVDRFGWDRIGEIIDRDGVFGFRLLPASTTDDIQARLLALGCRFDAWDVFVADRGMALAATKSLLARCPVGVTMLEAPIDPESAYTRSIQAEMHTAGIVPFSGSMLVGQLGPVTTVVAGGPSKEVMAVAHAYLPHNRFSPYQRYAWGGLVSVVERHRGKGLGNYINACMVATAFDRLGATHVYELVSATNQPSRRMVESCGLRHEPGFVCAVATRIDRPRFTR